MSLDLVRIRGNGQRGAKGGGTALSAVAVLCPYLPSKNSDDGDNTDLVSCERSRGCWPDTNYSVALPTVITIPFKNNTT